MTLSAELQAGGSNSSRSAAHFDLIRLLDHPDTAEPDPCAQAFACTTETPQPPS